MPKTSKKAASAKAEMRHVSTMIVGALRKKLGSDGEEWFYDLLWNNDRGADVAVFGANGATVIA